LQGIFRWRFKGKGFYSKSKIQAADIEQFCKLADSSEILLKTAMEKLGISTRGYSKILKVSRTIADLDGSELIEPMHIGKDLLCCLEKINCQI